MDLQSGSYDVQVLVVGSGFSGLTAACLLTNDGFDVTVLEHNWLPGGCVSSYPRKHYVFEAGATTLVGLNEGMPLHYLLNKIGLEIPTRKLQLPMRVHLQSGEIITRYGELGKWIDEAGRVFGPDSQKEFWECCYEISRQVWEIALKQRSFPPSNVADLLNLIRNFRMSQLSLAPFAFKSMEDLLKSYNLHNNRNFVDFVNEQLLITAQNYTNEVNVLFGATALCYTLFENHYVDGGMLNLVKPLVNYVEQNGGSVIYRNSVDKVIPKQNHYEVVTKKGIFRASKIIFGIPVNNVFEIFDFPEIKQRVGNKIMGSMQLNGAFSLGFVAKRNKTNTCLHHQIHLDKPMPFIRSKSIFLSLSHPDDKFRCGKDEVVGSVSTHIPDPENTFIENPVLLEEAIFELLEKRGFLRKEDLIYHHSSTPKSWEKWTRRSWGFVGGYPQYLAVKPWQMLDARLDHKGAYICGDSTYPGQGIPGTCLSGIIAAEKLIQDGFRKQKNRGNKVSQII